MTSLMSTADRFGSLRAHFVPEMDSVHPFLAHLVLILSIYDRSPSPSSIPTYNGPSTEQTDIILRALTAMARRMYAAEDTLNASRNSKIPDLSHLFSSSIPHSSSSSPPSPHNATSLAADFEQNVNISESCSDRERSSHTVQLTDRALDRFRSTDCPKGLLNEFVPPTPHGVFVSCPLCGSTSDNIAVSNVSSAFKTYSSPDFPLVVPPPPLIDAPFESDMGAVEELRLLKAQISDVARVCNAIARGDLSQKVAVPVHGVVMIQFRDVVNSMVEKLDLFASELTRVSQEVGAEGCVCFPPTCSSHDTSFLAPQ